MAPRATEAYLLCAVHHNKKMDQFTKIGHTLFLKGAGVKCPD